MGSSDLSSLSSSIGSDISSEDGDVREELSYFGVGKDELGNGLEVLESLLTLGLSLTLGDGSGDALDVLGVALSIKLGSVCARLKDMVSK